MQAQNYTEQFANLATRNSGQTNDKPHVDVSVVHSITCPYAMENFVPYSKYGGVSYPYFSHCDDRRQKFSVTMMAEQQGSELNILPIPDTDAARGRRTYVQGAGQQEICQHTLLIAVPFADAAAGENAW